MGSIRCTIMLTLDDNDDKTGALIKPALAVTCRLREISGIEHITISCCVNSCLAFTADYKGLDECLFCNEPRFDQRKHPRQTFDYIPITHRLRLQFANAKRAAKLQDYRKSLVSTQWAGGIRDYWDGMLHQEHKQQGFFRDYRDIGFLFSTDGVQLFKIGKFDIWPLLLINLNLPPSERVKKENLLLCGIIPGKRNPKDIHSFLRPMIDELKELEVGIAGVYDASTKSVFTLRAHLCLVSGDLPAIAKVMGISGHNSYEYCRFCKVCGIHQGHIYCPLQSPFGWPDDFEFDPMNLPLRTDQGYRHSMSPPFEYANSQLHPLIFGQRHIIPFILKNLCMALPNTLPCMNSKPSTFPDPLL